jgi:carbon monoxide dehydrogenase subunit G
MEIEKSLRLEAAPAQVWALLLDPEAMMSCVPGMQSVEVLGPDEYLAKMKVSFSFVSASFTLRTRIVESLPPSRLRAEGTGEENALANLEEEAGTTDFDAVAAAAKTAWNDQLSRIQIEADDRTKCIFYTALYHTMIAPALFAWWLCPVSSATREGEHSAVV